MPSKTTAKQKETKEVSEEMEMEGSKSDPLVLPKTFGVTDNLPTFVRGRQAGEGRTTIQGLKPGQAAGPFGEATPKLRARIQGLAQSARKALNSDGEDTKFSVRTAEDGQLWVHRIR